MWKALLPVEKTKQTLVKLQNSSWLKTLAMFHQANKQAPNGCLYAYVYETENLYSPSQNTQCVVLNKGSWEACGIAVGTRTTLNSHYL